MSVSPFSDPPRPFNVMFCADESVMASINGGTGIEPLEEFRGCRCRLRREAGDDSRGCCGQFFVLITIEWPANAVILGILPAFGKRAL